MKCFFKLLNKPVCSSFAKFFYCCSFCIIFLVGCGASQAQPEPHLLPTVKSVPIVATEPQVLALSPLPELGGTPAIHDSWKSLVAKLKADIPEAPVERYFGGLQEYSPAPMSVKVKELYKIKYGKKRAMPQTNGTRPPISSIYRGIVTAANVEKCQAFLEAHKTAFDSMEKRHIVSKEIIVSLLLVETKLGDYLGNDNAFWSLASMAASDTPELVKPGVPGLSFPADREAWLKTKLEERSAWAYKELKALLVHCSSNNINPTGMPGSVYGAIGICQFMPSNLAKYGDDGDGDGKVDLFNPADAIASAGKYLAAHGWRSGLSVAEQRAVLKKYNNLTRYANTILAMGESIKSGTLLTAAPDAPKANAKAATKSSAKPAAKKIKKVEPVTVKKPKTADAVKKSKKSPSKSTTATQR